MIDTCPRFPVTVLEAAPPIGPITHAVMRCPRCLHNIGINAGMKAGIESIICMGRRPDGKVCGGHYYLHGSELAFIGTVERPIP